MCGQTTCKHGKTKWANRVIGGSMMLALLIGIVMIQGRSNTEKALNAESRPELTPLMPNEEDQIQHKSLYGDEEALRIEDVEKSRAFRITRKNDDPGILLIVPEELSPRLSEDRMAVIFSGQNSPKSLILTYGSGWQVGTISQTTHVNLRRESNQEDVQGELIRFANEL